MLDGKQPASAIQQSVFEYIETYYNRKRRPAILILEKADNIEGRPRRAQRKKRRQNFIILELPRLSGQ
jgi:hypothetical protein